MRALRRAFRRLFLSPYPLRYTIAQATIEQYRKLYGVHHYGKRQYRDCLLEGANLAVKLGHERMTAVEFGVAGGNGLVALERIAADVERCLPIEIDLFGFDLGTGMPPPTDHRDLPWNWGEGYFRMDRQRVEQRLSRAKLVLGDVHRTVPAFVSEQRAELVKAPLGSLLVDVDYYSSTTDALRILEAAPETRLPRVPAYFDDLLRTNRYIGQWLAIREFNEKHQECKIAFRFDRIGDPEHRQLLEVHDFSHKDYCRNVRQRPTHIPDTRL